MINNDNTIQENRDMNLDAIKGFLIVLVVLGHCIQYIYSPKQYDNNTVFRIIYSFHMPLFMFISGYLAFRPNKNIDITWLKKRAKNLVLPFIVWIFLGYLIGFEFNKLPITEKIINIVLNPANGGMWFLWVLFLNCCILYVVIKLFKKKTDVALIITVLVLAGLRLILSNVSNDVLGIKLCSYYIMFYVFGYLISKHKDVLIKHIKTFEVLCFVLFLPCAMFWSRIDNPLFMKYIEPSIDGNRILEMLGKIFSMFYQYYFVAFLGIGFTFFIFYRTNIDYIKSKISIIGQYTLEIYILQWYFIKPFFDNALIDSIISFFLATFFSIAIAILLEKNRLLGLLLFGRMSKK